MIASMRRCSLSIGDGGQVFHLGVDAKCRRCQYASRFGLVYVLESIPVAIFVERIVNSC